MKKKSIKTNRYIPDENIPDRVFVPDNTILVITDHDDTDQLAQDLIKPLKGMKKRKWLLDHAYFCLPLTIGNQYGFIVESLYDFWLLWNGGELPQDVTVRTQESDVVLLEKQFVVSHFGMGIVTIQNRWAYRTPKGINLITIAPPNYWIDGVVHMFGVVEADNLRRDFTFNLKITRVNKEIFVPKGSPIGCIIPYPRHFIDSFKISLAANLLEKEVIEEERRTQQYFGIERSQYDVNNVASNGFRYMLGEDIYGNKFKDHQKDLNEDERD